VRIDLFRLLLMLSFPVLAGLGFAGLQVANAQQQRTKLSARIASLRAGAERRIAPSAAAPIARAAPVTTRSPFLRALALFGCDYERREIYDMPWWLVLLLTCGIGRLATAFTISLFGPIAWLDWPFVWVMASRSMFGMWEGRRRDNLRKQMPDALAMIVRCVRVGIPATEAIRLAGRESPEPTATEFTRMAEEIAIGTPLDAALRAAASRTGLPEYRFFATAISLQSQTGGGLTEALETLAEVIRKRVALSARGYALTSEARTSTIILCAMPFLMMLSLLVMNREYVMVLFTTQTGNNMLTVGGILLITAIMVMRRMIRATLS
jgi:tight adherence protein B